MCTESTSHSLQYQCIFIKYITILDPVESKVFSLLHMKFS